jgi:acetyl-CoA C-acetyltransferase
MQAPASAQAVLATRVLPVVHGGAGVLARFASESMDRVPAVRAGLHVRDLNVLELNEAFAAQALAVMQALDLPADCTNPTGSSIALGHPIGTTGAILRGRRRTMTRYNAHPLANQPAADRKVLGWCTVAGNRDHR